MVTRNFPHLAVAFALLAHTLPLRAADWPMGRYDARRSAASPQELPAELHLHWTRDYPPQRSAWPDQDKMPFDLAFDPIVLGQTLFVNSSRQDCVRALDVVTGAEKWTFFTEGPVRFAPAGWNDRLFVASDDGYLYCLDAADGKMHWKIRGGPSDRKILGNERLISTWPARGAPVVVDGTVCFAASIWPFMGIFIHAVDARTGQVVWTNDGDGSLYMKQPHNTDSFASIAPQGPIVAIGDTLLLPGGRSVPACFDRKTGRLLRYQLAENGKRGGGSEVAAVGDVFFNGGAAFEIGSEKYLAEYGKQVVLTPDVVYTYSAGACRAYDLTSALVKEVETVDAKGKTTKATRWAMDEITSVKTPVVERLIKAGKRLYLGTTGLVQAIELDLAAPTMTPGWQAEVEGNVLRLIAAADRLIAVTQEGRIYCFGAEAKEAVAHPWTTTTTHTTHRDAATAKSAHILEATGVRAGYCVAWGVGDGRLLAELARQSKLHIIAVEPDLAKVQRFRAQFAANDLYGTRIAIHHGDPATFPLPPYLASLMICPDAEVLPTNPTFSARLFEALRPYGGAACFFDKAATKTLVRQFEDAKLPGATVVEKNGLIVLTRGGALPGSANWTHEHADASNTRVSKDRLVKAPLGLLWFGGPSHDGILPRHGHGPQPQVVDGRILIEGIDLLRAMDIYTGRLLWEAKIPGVGKFYNNLAHQPGANASGSNFVSLSDGIYVFVDSKCVRLDPETGHQLAEFWLPELGGKREAPRWGYLNVSGDYLVAAAEPLFDPSRLPKPPAAKKTDGQSEVGAGDSKAAAGKKPDEIPALSRTLDKVLKLVKGPGDNMSASRHLVVMNRHTGQVLWSRSAKYAFRHNAICIGGGRLYAIDRLSGEQLSRFRLTEEDLRDPFRVLAFDLATGNPLWEADDEVFGTWLSYSAKHDVLIETGRVARDALTDEPRGMRAFTAKDGKVLWYEKNHNGPAMIHGDMILQKQGACDLLTGALKKRMDPITGEWVPWVWSRNYGCDTPAASEHLLTFRSGAAGYFDLCNDGGTGNFGGFRSSCTNNLIVAGGVLTVPEYTRTCTCAYQNQTSVGLIHMPEAEQWTFFGTKELKGAVKRLGIAFGAPGDRKSEDGTLWLEYPIASGLSPAITVSTIPKAPETFRRHSSQVSGSWNWVAASGFKGVSELKITLDKDASAQARTYLVRLIFVEPERVEVGQRLFDVAVQNQTVVRDLDIVKEAGAPLRSLVKEVRHVEAADGTLTVRLTPAAAATLRTTILCGIEVVAER